MVLRTDLDNSTANASIHPGQHNEVNAAVLNLEQIVVDQFGDVTISGWLHLVPPDGSTTNLQVVGNEGGMAVVVTSADQGTDYFFVDGLGNIYSQGTLTMINQSSPPANIGSGGILYAQNGDLMWVDSNDTVTQVAPPTPQWVQITQADYDALSPADPNTLYVVVG